MELKQNRSYKLPLSKLEIINEYISGKSCYKLAKLCNCTPQSIFSILKKANIQRRSLSNAAREYYCDESFFKTIDSESKAYFLGLLYADGNISGNTTSISLQDIDKPILEQMKYFLKYTGEIKPIKKVFPRQPQNRLSINSIPLIQDLLVHGLFPNKSFKLKFPDTVPPSLIHHFIRGYFDGDGCIYYYKKKKDYHFSLISTLEFVKGVQDTLVKELNLNRTSLYNPPRLKGKNIYTLHYYGTKQVMKIRDWLYKDATIFLTRKKNKFYIPT